MLMKKLTYTLPQKSSKKDFIFNMFGSLINAAVSVSLLVVVSWIMGEKSAGMFSLSYSTAQMMYTICLFEMRNIQVTDVKREFGFESIFTFRIITTILMWLFFTVFSLVRGYSGEKFFLMTVLTAYMSLLSFSDLFQGSMHINGYLSLAGISLACEVAGAAISFIITLVITKNLLLSVAMMILVVILWIAFYDIPYSNNFVKITPKFNFVTQKRIFLCALPLFLSSFMHQYIFNSPKYAIDSFLTDVEQSHYGYLVMPVFCINLLSIFVFRPQIVTLSKEWAEKRYVQFKKTITKLYLWVATVTVMVLGVGYLLGIPVLEMLYSTNLSGKRNIFMILLLSGGFSAACTLTLTLLTTMRKQKLCLIAYLITMAFALSVPKLMVASFGLMGAAISYLCEMALLFVVMFALFVLNLKKAMKENI